MINQQKTTPIVYVDISLLDVIDQPMPEQSQGKKERYEKSIKAHGMIYPIVAEKQTNGRYTVIDGRTRLEIVKNLGWTHVPCSEREDDGTAENKILSIELELCRRHLSEDDQEDKSRELEKIINTSQESFRDQMLRSLSPEMKIIYKKIESNGMTQQWRTLFWMIGHFPHSAQRAFFDNNVETNMMEPSIIEDLNSKIDELDKQLEATRAREESLRTSEKSLRAALEKTKANFREMAADHIRKKEAELEEKYREENLSDKRIKYLLDEERKKVIAEYTASMKETQQKLVDLSKAQADTKKELEFLRAEKKSWDQRRKEDSLILEKRKDELEYSKKVIKSLSKASIIAEQLKINLESMRTVKLSLTMLGDTPIENAQKEEIIMYLEKIKDNCTMIAEGLNKEPAKSKKAA